MTYLTNTGVSLYDIYLLQPFLEEIPHKDQLAIAYRIGSKLTRSPQELRVATHLFAQFFKMLAIDLMTKPVYFKYSKTKTIRLFRQDHPPIIKKTCQYLSLLPSMPVYNIVLQDRFKNQVHKKHFTLHNELKDMLQTKTRESDLCTASTKMVGTHDYIPIFKEMYPELSVSIIRKIINHGVKYLFLPVRNKQVQLLVQMFYPTKRKLQSLSQENPSTRQFTKTTLMRFTGKHDNESFYVLLTSKQKALLDQGKLDEVKTFHVYSMNLVRLFCRRVNKNHTHIYKIKDTHKKSYKSIMFKDYVKTAGLEYVYRRVNNRFKPVDNTK